jgi:hypothetical protein
MAYLLEMENIIKTIQRYVETQFGSIPNLVVKRGSSNFFQINYRR